MKKIVIIITLLLALSAGIGFFALNNRRSAGETTPTKTLAAETKSYTGRAGRFKLMGRLTQVEKELRAFADFTFHSNPASQFFNYQFTYIKTKTGSFLGSG